jgi:hypothetical protein
LDGWVACDENDGDRGVRSQNLTEQLNASHARQVQIGEDQVKAPLRQQAQSRLTAGCGLGLIAFVLKNLPIDFALPFFVVNNQNGSPRHGESSSG